MKMASEISSLYSRFKTDAGYIELSPDMPQHQVQDMMTRITRDAKFLMKDIDKAIALLAQSQNNMS